MKRILSLALSAVMIATSVPFAYANEDWKQGTKVEYVAQNNENWTITVPAKLNPGQNGTVTLEGMWPDNKTVSVTADPTVTLTNSILASDQKVLNVAFDGISEAGNNTKAQEFSKPVSVADVENALFGTWTGKFNYNVETAENVPIVTKFNIQQLEDYTEDESYLNITTSGNTISFNLTDSWYDIRREDYDTEEEFYEDINYMWEETSAEGYFHSFATGEEQEIEVSIGELGHFSVEYVDIGEYYISLDMISTGVLIQKIPVVNTVLNWEEEYVLAYATDNATVPTSIIPHNDGTLNITTYEGDSNVVTFYDLSQDRIVGIDLLPEDYGEPECELNVSVNGKVIAYNDTAIWVAKSAIENSPVRQNEVFISLYDAYDSPYSLYKFGTDNIMYINSESSYSPSDRYVLVDNFILFPESSRMAEVTDDGAVINFYYVDSVDEIDLTIKLKSAMSPSTIKFGYKYQWTEDPNTYIIFNANGSSKSYYDGEFNNHGSNSWFYDGTLLMGRGNMYEYQVSENGAVITVTYDGDIVATLTLGEKA